MRIEEIEQQEDEGLARAETIEKSVEDQRERVDRLTEALGALEGAGVESDALDRARESMGQEKESAERDIDELHAERDQLLEQNQELIQKCESDFESRKAAHEKIARIAGGPGAEAMSSVIGSLESDMNRLAQAQRDLTELQSKLESIR